MKNQIYKLFSCILCIIIVVGMFSGTAYAQGDKTIGLEHKSLSTYSVMVVGGNADKTEYAPGETVTITAYPAASGKQFAKWITEDGVTFSDATKSTTTFIMPAKDVRVDATYEDESIYSVTVVGGNADKTEYVPGETVTITAYPAASGKQFAKWTTEDGVTFSDATKSTTTFIMPAKDVRVDSTYEDKAIYKVTVVGGNADKTEYVPGETVTITAYEPASDMQFSKWITEDGVTFTDVTKSTTTFIMPAKDVRVDATYEDEIPSEYCVTVVGGNADKTKYVPGETVTITAYPAASDTKFAKWITEDGVTFTDVTKSTTTFIMPAKDVRVDATYEDEIPSEYSVTVVGGNADKTEYVPGETVTITAYEPASDTKFAKWITEDGVTFVDATKTTTTFVMPAKDVRVDATYEDEIPSEYSVTVVGGNADKTKYAPGETVTITAYPAASGKQFAKWITEDGVTFADVTKTTTTFIMPESDVTVEAKYEEINVSENYDDANTPKIILWIGISIFVVICVVVIIVLKKKKVF